MSVVKNLMIRAGADFSEVRAEFDKATRTLKSFQKNATTTMTTTQRQTASSSKGMTSFASKASKAFVALQAIAATLAIGKVVKDSVASAMQFESAVYQISRTLGANSSDFEKWAKTQAMSYGMSQAAAMKYGAVYSNLISGFSDGTAETTSRTEELLKTSAVVASATGRTMEDVMDRIRSGLLGNTEAIEDLGINVNVAMIESTDAFKKFANGKSWQQLDFKTQQQIRLMAILEQSNKKYGDTLAGTTATLQMKFLSVLDNIKLSLGNAFLPIYNAVLPALTAMATAISNVVDQFAGFMQTLFGYKISKATATTNTQAKAVDNLANSYENAGAAAKKTILGIDEINAMNDTTSASAAGGTTSGTTTTGTTGVSEEQVNKYADAVERFKKLFDFETLKTSWDNLLKALKPIGQDVLDGLKWLYDNILVPFAQWTINDFAPAFLDALASSVEALGRVIDIYRPGLEYLFTYFLKPIGEFTGGMIVGWLKSFSDGVNDAGNAVTNQKWKILILEGVMGAIAIATGNVPLALAILVSAVISAFGMIKQEGLTLRQSWEKMWIDIGNVFINWGNNLNILWVGFLNGLVDEINNLIRLITGKENFFDFELTPVITPVMKYSKDLMAGLARVEAGNINKKKIGGATQFATGGIVSESTFAQIGEAGAEAVIPLENSNFIRDFASTIGNIISNTGDQPINIYIDGVLDRAVSNAKRKNARAGRVVIPIGV